VIILYLKILVTRLDGLLAVVAGHVVEAIVLAGVLHPVLDGALGELDGIGGRFYLLTLHVFITPQTRFKPMSVCSTFSWKSTSRLIHYKKSIEARDWWQSSTKE
jgi:hypothetical protein